MRRSVQTYTVLWKGLESPSVVVSGRRGGSQSPSPMDVEGQPFLSYGLLHGCCLPRTEPRSSLFDHSRGSRRNTLPTRNRGHGGDRDTKPGFLLQVGLLPAAPSPWGSRSAPEAGGRGEGADTTGSRTVIPEAREASLHSFTSDEMMMGVRVSGKEQCAFQRWRWRDRQPSRNRKRLLSLSNISVCWPAK